MSKKVDVYICAHVSKWIGEVECKNIEDFKDKAYELWESQGHEHPTFCHQCSIDTSDWDIDADAAKYDFPDSKAKVVGKLAVEVSLTAEGIKETQRIIDELKRENEKLKKEIESEKLRKQKSSAFYA